MLTLKSPLPAITVSAALLLTAPLSAFVVTYDFDNPQGGNPDLSPVVTGADAAGVNADDFNVSVTDGNSAISTSTNMAYIRSSVTENTVSTALDGARYFSFTISAANPSDVLDLDSFTIDIGGSSDAGNYTANFLIQSSVDGFGSSNPTVTLTPDSKQIFSGAGRQLSASSATVSGSSFDAVSSIEFRIYAWDTVNNTDQIDRFDNVVVSGTVIPEPATYAALFGVATLALIAIRRRRA